MGGVPPPSGPTVQFGESVRLGGACPLWDRPTSDVGTLPVSTRNWPATFADASRSVVKSRGVESEKTFRYGTCGPEGHSEARIDARLASYFCRRQPVCGQVARRRKRKDVP